MGGYMDIERDVRIEIVSDDAEVESGHSIGSRAASRLPQFTEAERRAELGDDVVDGIKRIFQNVE